ncbi:MAG: (d)CMP kinase [Firmicutes bacterium]|nr:(d)CMP kinase [Bacillota bacterium]
MSFKIAIDGPSSSGKSTLAKMIAKNLGFVYIDTGAMYRAMGYYFLKNNLDLNDIEIVNNNVNNVDVELNYVDGVLQVLLNGEDISGVIRKEEVGSAGSIISTYKLVRERLVSLQQKMASVCDVVMDGRDIGTVVLPDANVKIYLNADCHERAVRRHKELLEKGIDKSLEEVETDLKERDYRDMNRENSPLRKANDAIEIDSTNMEIEEVVEMVLSIVKEKRGDK